MYSAMLRYGDIKGGGSIPTCDGDLSSLNIFTVLAFLTVKYSVNTEFF